MSISAEMSVTTTNATTGEADTDVVARFCVNVQYFCFGTALVKVWAPDEGEGKLRKQSRPGKGKGIDEGRDAKRS